MDELIDDAKLKHDLIINFMNLKGQSEATQKPSKFGLCLKCTSSDHSRDRTTKYINTAVINMLFMV